METGMRDEDAEYVERLTEARDKRERGEWKEREREREREREGGRPLKKRQRDLKAIRQR